MSFISNEKGKHYADICLLNTDMRHKTIIRLSIILLSILIFAGCEVSQCTCFCSDYEAKELILNDTIDLKYRELYCDPAYAIRLSFDSISDSRCPIGASCFWEGNASIKFIVTDKRDSVDTFRLNTFGGYHSDTLVGGLRYELIDLLPYPEIGKDYSLDDYTVQVLISD
jgi:hypothetical protein